MTFVIMEQGILKIVNNCFITNIYSYLETSGGQSYNPVAHASDFLLWNFQAVG